MSWEDEDIDSLFQDANAGKIPPFEESFWEEMEGMLPETGEGVDAVFVQAAASSAIPPYKEAYWKEMEGLLPKRKRRIAAYWWYSSAGAFLLLLSGYLIWTNQNNASDLTNNHLRITHNENNQGRSGTRQPGNLPAEELPAIVGSVQATLIPCGIQCSNPFLANARSYAGSDSVSCGSGTSGPCGPLESDRIKKVNLLPALTTGVSYSMARAGNPVLPEIRKDPRFYVQMSAGIGQSMLKTQKNNLIHSYALGAGVFKDANGVRLSFGLQGKVDFVNNFAKHSELTNELISESQYKQLYSLETPLSASCLFGKSAWGIYFSPGLQLGYTGTYSVYKFQDGPERQRVTGKMPYNRTLTMESGFTYSRQLNRSFYIGAAAGADLIRPLGDQNEFGENRLLPLNCSVFLRATF